MRRLFESFLVEPLRRMDREQREFLGRPESHRPDWKTMTVLVTAAIVLTLQNYFGGQDIIRQLALHLHTQWNNGFSQTLYRWVFSEETAQLAGWLYWALFSFATYFFIPWFVLAVVFRERLRDYGCKLRGAFTDWWVYLVFFAVMGPLLFWVSSHAHFQRTFPFYEVQPGEPLWPNFWTWELAYFLQFIGLEFFFRGFMVHGTKHRFGVYAVFVMAVPYCMIHYGKPMLESLGAIIAGVVLGYMSLKNRSIWLGAAIHMTVALSMDFLSMWRKHLLSLGFLDVLR